MNNRIKNIIILIIGAGAGALGSGFFFKKHFELIADKEIQDFKEFSEIKIKHYEELYRQQANDVINELGRTPVEEDVVENGPGPSPALRLASDVHKRYNTLTEKKELSEVMRERGLELAEEKPVSWDHPKEDEAEEEEQPEAPIVDDRTDAIYLISTEEFLSGKEEYDKITLTYYEGDNVLADERDGTVPAPTDVVGFQALKSFGREPKDPNVVYVRNNKVSCDFEILRSEGSYLEIVLAGGMAKEPKIRVEPKQKKRVAIRGDEFEVTDKPRKGRSKTDGKE